MVGTSRTLEYGVSAPYKFSDLKRGPHNCAVLSRAKSDPKVAFQYLSRVQALWRLSLESGSRTTDEVWLELSSKPGSEREWLRGRTPSSQGMSRVRIPSHAPFLFRRCLSIP